jgi:hypothetical protein
MHTTERSLLDQGTGIVREAEEKMRGLLMKAVEERDDEAIPKLYECAKELRAISEKTDATTIATVRSDEIAPTMSEYPKFFRHDDKLVMIGWSKKGRTEYKHEAPRIVLKVLVSVLSSNCSAQEPITFDKLLPLITDPKTGGVFPAYYVRSFLRWLKTIGIVTKYGHSGYSIENSQELETTINSHWRRLGKLDG